MMSGTTCGSPVLPGSRARASAVPGKLRRSARRRSRMPAAFIVARGPRSGFVAGAALATGLLAAPLLAMPFGRMRDPLALVLVLPPLASALEAFGWSDVIAGRIRRLDGGVRRALVAYLASLVTSALLTLDVAAVAAASVGVATADDSAERDVQVGSAIVGSNAGSLLFPFSNLTNLVLLTGAGVSFAAYVEAAVLPQFGAALGIGAVLAWRSRRRLARGATDALPRASSGRGAGPRLDVGTRATGFRDDAAARAAATIAVVGAGAAVVAGFAGGDIPVVFASASALVSSLAVASGRTSVRRLVASVPLPGIAVIVAATALTGEVTTLARSMPVPLAGRLPAIDLVAIALVGGGLASLVNNLPAAAFGAVWLHAGGPIGVVAYLVGTNVVALATPHGSLATILCRSVASGAGHEVPVGPYVRAAWRYALAGGLAALLPLALVSALR